MQQPNISVQFNFAGKYTSPYHEQFNKFCCILPALTSLYIIYVLILCAQIAKTMGPTWDPPGSYRPRWAPRWPHEPLCQGRLTRRNFFLWQMRCIATLNTRGLDHLGFYSLIARFMGPTWGPNGADSTKVGPMWATRNLLSGYVSYLPFHNDSLVRWGLYQLIYSTIIKIRLVQLC